MKYERKSTSPPPHPKTNPAKIIHRHYLFTASLLERLHKHHHIFLAVQECSEPLRVDIGDGTGPAGGGDDDRCRGCIG